MIWKPDIAYRGVVGPSILDFVPTAASCHREEEQACHEQSAVEAIHLRQIYVRFNYVECKAFVSLKKIIHFIPSYLPDSKRLHSTTFDYKRLFNGLVLTRFASLQRFKPTIMETPD